jgi:uncharacterized protein
MSASLSFRDRPNGETVLLSEQVVARSTASVFAFHADAHNLERITPPFLHFVVLAISTGAVAEGTLIDYRLRLHGVPVRWRSRIESWQPPCGFVDRQVRGPYALWHHTHEFESHRHGTLVRDRVRYRLPFGAVGAVIAAAAVRCDLETIFTFRSQTTRLLLADSAGTRPITAAVQS